MIKNFDKYKTFGRYKILDDKVIFYNGGSGLSFKMKGTSFKVDLANIGDPGSFRVFVDKNYNYGIQLPYNQSEVIISFETYDEPADPNGIHYVDIVKVNEANDNELQISNIHIYGKLLDYDFTYKYKVKEYKDGKATGNYIEKEVEVATMFDINKTIMRCLVKNIAMFGLGLYIYSGEDLPEGYEMTKEEASQMKVNFGKYKEENLTLGELLKKDRSYLEWAVGSDKVRQAVRDACAILLDTPNEEDQNKKLNLMVKLNDLVIQTNTDRNKIYQHYKVESDKDMTIAQLQECVDKLLKKVGE